MFDNVFLNEIDDLIIIWLAENAFSDRHFFDIFWWKCCKNMFFERFLVDILDDFAWSCWSVCNCFCLASSAPSYPGVNQVDGSPPVTSRAALTTATLPRGKMCLVWAQRLSVCGDPFLLFLIRLCVCPDKKCSVGNIHKHMNLHFHWILFVDLFAGRAQEA